MNVKSKMCVNMNAEMFLEVISACVLLVTSSWPMKSHAKVLLF